MTDENELRPAADAGDWTEAEAFVLYWTQYFDAPISAVNLQTLWAMPRVGESVASARPPLPILDLLSRGLLTKTRQGSREGLSFCRKALTGDQMRRLLSLPDAYDWIFWTSNVVSWTSRALSDADGKAHRRKGESARRRTRSAAMPSTATACGRGAT